jgi:hypothetical protein
MDTLVSRMYAALVDALEARGGHDFDTPVPVTEIYRDLVPYPVVRSRLGLALNADYEDVLLRLLSGEEGWLELEPAAAREELRREASASNPRTGLFRKFGESTVLVRRPEPGPGVPQPREPEPTDAGGPSAEEAGPGTGESADAPGEGEGPEGVRFPFESDRRAERPRDGAPPPGDGTLRLVPPDATEEPSFAGKPCAFCPETLPDDPRIRYCPYCGGDQRLWPCARCGAVLERGWRFCISCGHEIDQ